MAAPPNAKMDVM
jgi:large subunit ribosomal protein L28